MEKMENSEIETKMSTAVLLVSEILFYPFFGGGIGPILVPLGPKFRVTNNWEGLKLI